MKHKQPNKHTRFSLAIIHAVNGFTYRLGRRDITGRLHFAQATLQDGMDRGQFACALRKLHRELLEKVDRVELEVLGVTS